MQTFPIESLSLAEAMQMQFDFVAAVCRHFEGDALLTRGDLGVVSGSNQPLTTRKVEAVLADFFQAQNAVLVRGAGTNAIRLALHSLSGSHKRVLVHQAPVYPTTQVSLDMLGMETVVADFHDLRDVETKIFKHAVDAVLVQVTRQKLDDAYDLEQLIAGIRDLYPSLPIVTDDNYAVMKTKKIGVQAGANLSCFSTFKLLGPEGIGCVVGDKVYIDAIRKANYSGGGQVQGHEALDVLRGMVYVPVAQAISAQVGQEVCDAINAGTVLGVKSASIVNAQSRVIMVELEKPVAKAAIACAKAFGALPYPVGAESKYEFAPLFYRASGTVRQANPQAEDYMIRINPNRAGAQTILAILEKALAASQEEK